MSLPVPHKCALFIKMYFIGFCFYQRARSDQEFAGCAIERSARSAAWTNDVELPVRMAALQKVHCCLEASCHLPTEALGWFNLVLAQSPDSANP